MILIIYKIEKGLDSWNLRLFLEPAKSRFAMSANENLQEKQD